MIEKGGLSLKSRAITSVGFGALTFFGAFMVAFLASSNFTPVGDSSAANINVGNTATGYYANLSTSGAVDLEITATPSGAAKIGKDTLTVETNVKDGYKLYIGVASDAIGTALYNEDADGEIPASSGTVAEPVTLATNTWGYVPSRANSSDTAAEYEDADVDPEEGTAELIGVPAYGSENILYTNTTPTDSSTNTLDVYYGVNANTSLPSGEYSNTVVYTVIVDAVNSESKDASIAPSSQSSISTGAPVTISTGLYPGFSADNLGEITVKIGDNDCTGVTPSISEAGNLNIACTTPTQSAAGKYTVTVNVAKYNKTYVLEDGYEYTGIPEFFAITTMQQMTADVCKSVPTPSSSATATMTAAEYDEEKLVEGGSYVAQATLSDVRDTNTYIVRKLADGNCWMTQDLKLDGGVTLKGDTTDLASDTATFELLADNSGTWCQTDSSGCDDQSLMTKQGAVNGYLYNWYAATASSGKNSIDANITVDYSICPKGWKLPLGTTARGSLYDLAIKYNWDPAGSNNIATRDKFMTTPLDFNYAGYRAGGGTYNVTDSADYWTRTAHSTARAYYLNFNYNGVFGPLMGDGNKWYGFTIRCVAVQ